MVVQSTHRWPLLIDPQLQGIRWIKAKEGPRGFKILQQDSNKFMDTVRASKRAGSKPFLNITTGSQTSIVFANLTSFADMLAHGCCHGVQMIQCIEEGTPLLIENLPEKIDAALEPLVARQLVRRGRSLTLTLGGREVSYNQDFRLYLHTKVRRESFVKLSP